MEIKFNNVSYIYNEKTPLAKIALSDVNITFKKDKINGIVGPSGSGKTTLVELINALIVPTQGNIKVDSQVISKNRKISNINNLRHNIGLVFQKPEEQFFCNSVQSEIEFAIKYFHKKTKDVPKKISDALKMVGLDDSYLNKDPFSLSSGEKRKIAITSILAFNPKVIILDDPTVGLDDDSKNNLIKIIKMLNKRYNKTIIIISHDVDLLHKISDYIYVVYNGKIVLEGDKYEVFTNESLSNYNLYPPKIIQFEQLVRKRKNIKLMYRDDINDLMKDVYRYVK